MDHRSINSKAQAHGAPYEYGDSREHMGWVLYPRIRIPRRRLLKSPHVPPPDTLSADAPPPGPTAEEAPTPDAGPHLNRDDQPPRPKTDNQ